MARMLHSCAVIVFCNLIHCFSTFSLTFPSSLLKLPIIGHTTTGISIYKFGDVDISSNLIGSLSLANEQCPPPGRCIICVVRQ